MYTHIANIAILLLLSARTSHQIRWTDVEGSLKINLKNHQNNGEDDIDSYLNSMKNSFNNLFSFNTDNDKNDTEKLDNPDSVLTVPGRIRRNGYPCETHTVTSKGYILNIHRIPRSIAGTTIPIKTALLHHGLLGSSADWILNGPDKALAYALADAGYDVWMANIRGNLYSREHTNLKTDTKAYWNFSWHDVALNDVPVIIDYIKEVKGKKTKIAYLGHSMGTTILFAMLSLRPEYNDELVTGFALAPVVFMSEIKSDLVKNMIPIAEGIAAVGNLFGSHEFIAKKSTIGELAQSCNIRHIDNYVCKNMIFSVCGYNDAQYNETLLPIFVAHMGVGASMKTMLHYSQIMQAGGRFQMFDYGSDNNKLYGSVTPPEYDLGKGTVPIKLVWAQNDFLSSEKDIRSLYNKLPYGTEMYLVPDPKFNHLDYLWAKDAATLVNNKVLQMLNEVFNYENVF